MQRLVREQPELARCAIVLYEQNARYGQRVKTCSAAAWEQSVRPGMPLAEAQTLLAEPEKAVCPLFACHDAGRDREALLELAEWCEQFSPIVGLDQADEPDSLLLDVSGLAHLFGGEEALAQTVVAACRQQGLTARVAIADTAGAAWGFARWSESSRHAPCAARQRGRTHRESSVPPSPESVTAADGTRSVPATFVERVTAADGTRSVPATMVVLPPGDATVLDRLPVEALRLPQRPTEQLQRLGIRQIGQLSRLPRASLAARFGELLIERLDKLAGAVAEPIVAHHAREPLSVRWCFEHPTTHPEAIEHVLGELLSQLSRRLIEQGHGVLRLTCQLVCPNRQPLKIDISLFRPTVAPQHLLALAKLQLALVSLPDAVEEIRVRALATGPREQRQGELFGEAPREHPAQLALLVERLSNRLGREHVVRAELQAEPQAERAYRYRPLAGEAATSSSPAQPPTPLPGPLLRPLRLFDPPQPIDVVGIALDGPPAMFHYQRRRHRVARCFGPERIETGWWRGESSRRDYYRVETEAGSRWWLFRRLQDQRWFVQGTFE